MDIFHTNFGRMLSEGKIKSINIDDNIESLDKKINFIHENLSSTNISESDILAMKQQVLEAKSGSNQLLDIYLKYYGEQTEILNKVISNERANNLTQSYRNEFNTAFEKTKTIVDQLNENLITMNSNVNSPLEIMDNNSLFNFIFEYIPSFYMSNIWVVIILVISIIVVNSLIIVYSKFYVKK